MIQRTLNAASGGEASATRRHDATGPGEICEYRHWDSEFFGQRIAVLTKDRLTKQAIQQVRQWCDAKRIDCLYFLADPNDPDTTHLAEDAGFRLVDVRVTLERKLDSSSTFDPARGSVRSYQESDLPSLRNIARVSHRDSRFYYDGNFSQARCDALYETWIDRSVHGFADAVFVAVQDKGPVGYISCRSVDTGVSQIGLFAVAEGARGLGLGKQLIFEALRWSAVREAVSVVVVTQGRNIPAQRLYQKCGFVTRSVQYWFHWWPNAESSGGK